MIRLDLFRRIGLLATPLLGKERRVKEAVMWNGLQRICLLAASASPQFFIVQQAFSQDIFLTGTQLPTGSVALRTSTKISSDGLIRLRMKEGQTVKFYNCRTEGRTLHDSKITKAAK